MTIECSQSVHSIVSLHYRIQFLISQLFQTDDKPVRQADDTLSAFLNQSAADADLIRAVRFLHPDTTLCNFDHVIAVSIGNPIFPGSDSGRRISSLLSCSTIA